MIAFLMLLSRVLVPSWKEYNLGKESSLGGMTSQEYLFSGIWKQFGNVGEAAGCMTGLCVLMTKYGSHQRSFISCTPQICKAKSAWWWLVATLLVLSPSSGLVTVVGRPQFYDFVSADVIIAQLIVMIPLRLKESQYMGEMASTTTSSVTRLLCLSHQKATEFGWAHLFGKWAGECFIWVHAEPYKFKVRQQRVSPFTETVISKMNPTATEHLQPDHSLEMTYKPNVYVWETWVRAFSISKY